MHSASDFSKYTIKVALATALLLTIPLLAMQFSAEVVWTLRDFVMAGALLFGAGIAYGVVARLSENMMYRFGVGLTVVTALFMVWANLAVGLIGSEDEPANLMYFGLLAVGFLGAVLVRFQPAGMMRVLFATAGSQVLITVIALFAGMQDYPGSSAIEILSVNGFFLILWLGAALLFRNAWLEKDRDA